MSAVIAYTSYEELGHCKELMSIPYRGLLIIAIYESNRGKYISPVNLIKVHKADNIIPSSTLYQNLFKFRLLGLLECRRGCDDQRQMEFRITTKGIRAMEMFRKGISG